MALNRLSDSEKKQLLLAVQKITNAQGVIVVVTDSLIPCADERSGGECKGGHDMHMHSMGIHKDYVQGMLMTAVEQMDKKEDEDEEEDGEKEA